MRLSDIKGEDAIEVLANVLDPITEIAADEKVKKAFMGGYTKLQAAQTIMKLHPKAILKVFAILEREDPETYEPTLLEIPAKILDVLNDPAFTQFFGSQGQNQD